MKTSINKIKLHFIFILFISILAISCNNVKTKINGCECTFYNDESESVTKLTYEEMQKENFNSCDELEKYMRDTEDILKTGVNIKCVEY